MRTVGLISAGMIAIGAILTIIRVEKGPSSLDRIVALDIISNILIIAVALDAAVNLRRETIPILAALALVGFISSVTVARYAAVEPREARRIKTPEEVAAEEEALRREEEAAALAEAEAKAQRDEEIAP
ncbi:MAG TPA: monovalent cation/H+ antiporter complex subunit F [Acidimicrobiia bacterium]|nr:monovalent cation/H+ antiporter complex subunit F [Acidimicrobiia bacterium]